MKRHGLARPRTWAVIGIAALIAVVAAIGGLVNFSPNSLNPSIGHTADKATSSSRYEAVAMAARRLLVGCAVRNGRKPRCRGWCRLQWSSDLFLVDWVWT